VGWEWSEVKSRFLRSAAHKGVSSFGRNDGSVGVGENRRQWLLLGKTVRALRE